MSLVTTASPTTTDYSDLPAGDFDGAIALRGDIAVSLPMRHAGMREVRLRYELLGAANAPVVFVAGGISAHRHLAANAVFPEKGWVDGLVGAGRALDPASRRLLAIDFLGADGTLDAPIDTADQADAIAALLDALGIARLHGFVGYSYGALVGLQFATRHAGRVGTLIAVSGAHRAHPYAAAWRALQRRAVALGQLQCAENHGLALARQFAMLSYRTPEEFSERFDAPPEVINGRVRVAAEDYLDAAGAQYVARTPVTAYLRLSESIDLHRIDPALVKVPTVVVAVEGDRLVPLADMVSLVEGLGPRGSLRVLRSPYGHDAFLKEIDRIDAILTTALRLTGETA
ncbi:homoserine O-succinyltransferase MetX [Xanthomonas vesicatoria]|uniref:homoserine O-succinyltransferase MetX n=1 Tax=Xanthomonas vesicatoria TaxID=56460 RepID=UPI0007321892|nr:homoserine O-succinyltransferase [Xanthomonas vesicatoria]KTF36092.1 homoserine acetyltransferase [Xanthomonas vesicatoria]MCC8558941.1 homoserine O-succinyltransferase [Xanthomonas vesicatoria]MCC8601386.1 homoserine O-succinyltransferase [Xanthomonas vesicatoria]MCC8611442.1 homoserine O-succinyltransferase [Xanthomonas vesicatoria]MCC8673068.1 homoserine O-succinyltransferase [Xanthomonas vesicatoria]